MNGVAQLRQASTQRGEGSVIAKPRANGLDASSPLSKIEVDSLDFVENL